jgi:hypothetical protein
MFEFLKERISIICALAIGTAGGWSMTTLITAPELKPRLVTISFAVALVVSILVSVFFRKKLRTVPGYLSKSMRQLTWLLMGFVLSVCLFFIVYDRLTIDIPSFESMQKTDTLVVVKGLYHTDRANAYANRQMKKNHQYPTDDLLLNDFGYDLSMVWDNDSRSYARLSLLVLYTLVIALLVAAVSFGAEIILRYQSEPAP